MTRSCSFNRRDGDWVCARCGESYGIDTPDPPLRNCITTTEKNAAIAAMVLDSIAVFCLDCQRPADVLRTLIAACQQCTNFAGDGCRRGACNERWEKWREKLATGWCGKWKNLFPDRG
jgi:hypothetical protein